jgi:hypothetical protein
MQVTVSQIVKAIEVLSSIEKSSMTAFKDPCFVGKLQAEAWLAMWPLKHALEEAQLKVTVEE